MRGKTKKPVNPLACERIPLEAPEWQRGAADCAPSQALKESALTPQKAVDIRQIEKELNKIPDVRQDLVNRIKAQLEAGKYPLPARDVAEALLASSLEESLFR